MFTDPASGFVSHRPLNNHSAALFWRNLAIAGTEYVVHWYPVGNIEAIQWIRVVDTTAHITGKFNWMVWVEKNQIGWFAGCNKSRLSLSCTFYSAVYPGLQSQECYDGAVTALQSPAPKMASIKGISTWQSGSFLMLILHTSSSKWIKSVYTHTSIQKFGVNKI